MNLLQIVPWYWRWAAVAALAAAVLGYGYVRGYLHEERKLDLFQAQVDVLAKDAARRANERKAQQDKDTKEVTDAHARDVAAIRAHYKRLLDAAAGRRGLPAAADNPGRIDGAASECRPGDQGETDYAVIELESRAALDAAALLAWQDWARRNGFPVR